MEIQYLIIDSLCYLGMILLLFVGCIVGAILVYSLLAAPAKIIVWLSKKSPYPIRAILFAPQNWLRHYLKRHEHAAEIICTVLALQMIIMMFTLPGFWCVIPVCAMFYLAFIAP